MSKDVAVDINPTWTRQEALDLYLIRQWGTGYFDVSNSGEITVRSNPEDCSSITITRVIERAQSLGFRLPLLIRFQDLLRHRVENG